MVHISRHFAALVFGSLALVCGLVVTPAPAGAVVNTGTVIPSPSPSWAENPLNSVSCVTSTWCVAVGYQKPNGSPQNLVLMYDGTSWTESAAPNVDASWDAMFSVSCVSTTFCVAVGSSGTDAVTHVISWDGASWTTVESPNVSGVDSYLGGVSCLSTAYCVAVGLTRGGNGVSKPLSMVWDGVAWGLETPPDVTPGNNELTSVSCVSATYCVAVGT